jgi:hypothetical protein
VKLQHSIGFKLANDGQDTRAIQHYLGRKAGILAYSNPQPCCSLFSDQSKGDTLPSSTRCDSGILEPGPPQIAAPREISCADLRKNE